MEVQMAYVGATPETATILLTPSRMERHLNPANQTTQRRTVAPVDDIGEIHQPALS